MAARNGRRRSSVPGPRFRRIERVLVPASDLPLSLLQFGRGCVNRCEYCAVTEYFEHRHYARPVAEVVHEIRRIDNTCTLALDTELVGDTDGVLRGGAVGVVEDHDVAHGPDPTLASLTRWPPP